MRKYFIESVACNEDTEESDIDILIISNNREQIENIIDDEIARILYDKEELISAHIMDENMFNKTKNFTFIQNVLKDAVIIGWSWSFYNKSQIKIKA